MDKNKKVILITGCSSGFGMLTAARLASSGHQVIATMRNLNKQGALLAEVKARKGTVDLMQLDVTDNHSIYNLMKEVGAKYGLLDVLVNNAGYGIGGFFEDLSDQEIRDQMETNFFGVLNMIRAAIPLMRQANNAKIINISSVSGFNSFPCFSAYNASKWALEGFSESLRYELKFWDIDVLLIEPGTYRTKIFDENARRAKNFFNQDSPYYPISQHLDKKTRENLHDCHKDPEEIAVLVEKLIHSKNPSFRNIPDIESKTIYLLRKIIPFRILSYLISKALFKDFKLR